MWADIDVAHEIVLPVLVPVAVAIIVGLPVLGYRIFRIWSFLQQQMDPKQREVRPATTEGLPLRGAVDVNTSTTQRLESRVAWLGAQLSEMKDQVDESTRRFEEHLAWAEQEVARIETLEHRLPPETPHGPHP